MAESLVAEVDVPSIVVDDEEKLKFYPSIYFDYDTGDFVLDGSGNFVMARGQVAYKQWCIKAVLTERNTCLAYSDAIGVDFASIRRQPDFDAKCSEIEREFSEALMANAKTEYVREFEFSEPAPDSIAVSFTVKAKEYDEESIKVLISEG